MAASFFSTQHLAHCRFSLTIVLLCLGGCWSKPLEYVEVKRIDEVVTESELEDFLDVIRLMPDGKMPELPAIYREPVRWSASRTLPVNELVNEELAQIERPWDTDDLAGEVENHRRLKRVLRRLEMSPEQFMGLLLAVGTAMNRSQLPEDYDFDEVVQRGDKVIRKLKHNETPFVEYSPDRQFSVSREAVWLYRVDRAKRLREVPRENVELVRRHWDELSEIFPPEFTIDPLGVIVDQLEEKGIPFAELPATGNDAEIQWNPDEALIGTDSPLRDTSQDEGR